MGWKVVEEQEAKGSRCRLTYFRDLILGFQPFHRKVGLAWRWQVVNDVRGTIGFCLIISATLQRSFAVIPRIRSLKGSFCATSGAYRS